MVFVLAKSFIIIRSLIQDVSVGVLGYEPGPQGCEYVCDTFIPKTQITVSFVSEFRAASTLIGREQTPAQASLIRVKDCTQGSQAYGTSGPFGPLGSSRSQHRRTPELVLQKSHASFRITFRPPGAD